MEDYYDGSSDYEYYDRVYGDDEDGYVYAEDEQIDSSLSSAKALVIRKESLLAAQKEDLQRVMDLLSLKEHHARTLLIHYRWEANKVIDVLVERGKEWLYAEAGLLVEDNKNLSSGPSLGEMTCQICFEEVHTNEATTMECGHCFCNNCWKEHFTVKITEGQSRRITCMAYKCHTICDEEKIRNLVGASDPNMAEKFDLFLLESYIEDNKRVKWCPSVPHCGNAIRVEDEYREIECACGVQFCFSCSSEVHSPCSCLMWELWRKKCQDESETVNWITVNAKYCPKCCKPVEKNGGCNLVSCICGQSFCWLCGGATGFQHTWRSIEGHTCGQYKKDELEKLARAQKELHRYSHYFNRFKAHTDSLKLELNMKDKIREKISVLDQKKGLASEDFSWLTNGIYKLFRSRRILSYSYVFAYYVFGDILFQNEMTPKRKANKAEPFEDQQQQFEVNIERLSMFLEEPFVHYSEDEVQERKMSIMALSTVTDNLCKRLYDCIENDLLSGLKTTQTIAPYRSEGIEKASELPQNIL